MAPTPEFKSPELQAVMLFVSSIDDRAEERHRRQNEVTQELTSRIGEAVDLMRTQHQALSDKQQAMALDIQTLKTWRESDSKTAATEAAKATMWTALLASAGLTAAYEALKALWRHS